MMLRPRIEQYLTRTRPQLWNELSEQERNQLVAQVEREAVELEAHPPWPAPPTDDHHALVAYQTQVRTWAQENALQSLYDQWPIDEHDEDQQLQTDRPDLTAALDHQQEWARDYQKFVDELSRDDEND